jgi:hypothetical protein
MSFDPHRFLDVADELGLSSEECKLRTAVGRAYFGLHLVARERLGIKSSKDEHRLVKIDVIKQDAGAGHKLKALEKWRILADYLLLPPDESQANWQENWQEVQDLVRDILPRLAMLKERGSR